MRPHWTRVSQPSLHTWTDEPVRLVEQSVAKHDAEPKALACYGLLVRSAASTPDEVWLRFVDGRPISAITTQFLAVCCDRLAARGKTALLLVWDNASWHISQAVKGWIRDHNRRSGPVSGIYRPEHGPRADRGGDCSNTSIDSTVRWTEPEGVAPAAPLMRSIRARSSAGTGRLWPSGGRCRWHRV